MKKWLGVLTFIGVLCISSLGMAQATPQAVLTWNANPEPNVVGYRLYKTVQPGDFGPPEQAIPLVTMLKVFLPSSRCTVTYYFAISAVNNLGLESGLSNPVQKTIQGTQYWIGACKK